MYPLVVAGRNRNSPEGDAAYRSEFEKCRVSLNGLDLERRAIDAL